MRVRLMLDTRLKPQDQRVRSQAASIGQSRFARLSLGLSCGAIVRGIAPRQEQGKQSPAAQPWCAAVKSHLYTHLAGHPYSLIGLCLPCPPHVGHTSHALQPIHPGDINAGPVVAGCVQPQQLCDLLKGGGCCRPV